MPLSLPSVSAALLGLFLLFQAVTPSCPAAEASAAPEGYAQALQQAEEELRRLESGEEEAGKGGGGWGLSEALAVVALLAALALMAWAMRWSRGSLRRMPGREMRLLDRMALGRNTSLVLVRLRGRDYWLAEGQNAVTLLADWPAPEEK